MLRFLKSGNLLFLMFRKCFSMQEIIRRGKVKIEGN